MIDAIDDEGSGVIGRADEATHPELLEGVRLPRCLPEEGDEVHAVALGLEVGHRRAASCICSAAAVVGDGGWGRVQ